VIAWHGVHHQQQQHLQLAVVGRRAALRINLHCLCWHLCWRGCGRRQQQVQDCTLHPLFVVQLYFCSCSQSASQELAGGWGCPSSSPVSAYRANGAISGQLQSSCSCFDASVHGTPGTCSWVLCFCIMQLWSCSCRCLPQVQQWLPLWFMGWQ
jgi:hypothetical protein